MGWEEGRRGSETILEGEKTPRVVSTACWALLIRSMSSPELPLHAMLLLLWEETPVESKLPIYGFNMQGITNFFSRFCFNVNVEGINLNAAITFYTGLSRQCHVHVEPVGHCLVCSLMQSLSPCAVFDPRFVF